MQDIDIALLIALNVFLHSVLIISQILLYKALWQENKDITVPLNLC